MYDYFKPECDRVYAINAAINAIGELNLKKLQVPAYYKDKIKHEKSKALLEEVGYVCGTLALGYLKLNEAKYINKSIQNITTFCKNNTGIRPKFADDTQLVICTRLYHLVDAATMLKSKMTASQRTTFETWLKNIYIPSCKYLTESIFHKTSNHGAWGYLGLTMAYSYLNDVKKLLEIANAVDKRIKNIGKQPWYTKIFGNYTTKGKSEFWVENIRTKSGLYYTYYHTIPLLKTYQVLFQNGIQKYDILKAVKSLTDQIFLYATEQENWKYMNQSKIWGIKQIQQLIFPSGDTFRVLTSDGKSAVLFEMVDHVMGTDDYKDWYSPNIPLNHDGPYRHSSVRNLIG